MREREPSAGFDVIGDVHGCHDELGELLERLGYARSKRAPRRWLAPAGRTAVFLGDLVDRGPRVPEVVETVMDMVADGAARCVLGNHEHQFLRHLEGDFPLAWGLEQTMEQLAKSPPELLERLRDFARALPYRFALDEGRLLVVHAGCPEELQGSDSPESRQFALYANPTTTRRLDWAPAYRGAARVVYGHTPTDAPEWVNGTICIDTGCVYGGALTALRYPELELVSVPARRVWTAGP